jgi:hypothetical protein
MELKILDEYKKFSSHLGNYYPYYFEDTKETNLYLNFDSALKGKSSQKIDIAGVVEAINYSYLLGDRTLIKGLKKLSWMTSYDNFKKPYNLIEKLPDHLQRNSTSDEISKELKIALKNELISYITGKKNVAILLSGGLDSRILAGLLKELELNGDFNGSITAVTWGIENSRDVIYSKEISNRFKWNFIHLAIDSNILLDNIKLSARYGSEFSAYHLHSMSLVRDLKNIDVIIAASYGDSVGRGEFSGKKLLKLKPKHSKINNPYGLLRQNVLKESKLSIFQDGSEYKNYISRKYKHHYLEIEQELHYMRRKLQAALNIIGEKIPLYQLFTSPETYGLMWSLNPQLRTDDIYKKIILTLPSNIANIPWARNNIAFNQQNKLNITASKHFHKYGKWAREDLKSKIRKLVLSDEILSIELFNQRSLVQLLKIWEKQKTITVSKIDELIMWIASFSELLSHYDVKCENKYPFRFIDSINTFKGFLTARIYIFLRNILRK